MVAVTMVVVGGTVTWLVLSVSFSWPGLSRSGGGGVQEANVEAEGIGGGGGYPDSR